MNLRLLFVHALSPLHPGTGQSVGAIDLAIARERATGIPYVPGSSIKGVLRDTVQTRRGAETVRNLFGPPTDRAHEHAGSVHFGDARLLFLPVRSFAGTFGYVTSPYLLQRLAHDAREAGLDWSVPTVSPAGVERCRIAPESALRTDGRVVFEDLDLEADDASELGEFADTLARELFAPGAGEWEATFARRIAVVHDDVMSFLLETATEVDARIRLDDDTKTVAKGALWYEENLPAESILVAAVLAAPPKRTGLSADEALAAVSAELAGLVQLGGNATVGRGLCRPVMVGGAA